MQYPGNNLPEHQSESSEENFSETEDPFNNDLRIDPTPGQILLNNFLSFSKKERKHLYKLLKDESRPIKYLFAINNLPESFSTFLWGILRLEEADEVEYQQKVYEFSNIHQLLNEIPKDSLNQKQSKILSDLFDTLRETSNITDYHNDFLQIGLSNEQINNCHLSLKETISKMVMEDDGYLDLAQKFRPEYLDILAQFNQLIQLMITRRFPSESVNEAILTNTISNPQTADELLLTRLETAHYLFGYLEENHPESAERLSALIDWEQIARTHFTNLCRKMSKVPQNKTYPEVTKNIRERSKQFMSFFPKQLTKQQINSKINNMLLKLLICLHAIELDPISKKNLIEWFKKTVQLPQNINQSQQQKEDLLTLSKLSYIAQLQNEQIDLSKTPERIEEKEQEELKLLAQEMLRFTQSYLTDEDKKTPKGSKALYSFMSDYQLLYALGIFDYNDYKQAEDKQYTTQEHNGKAAIRDRSITEIFKCLLDENYVLPLKKEYLDGVEQLRTASRLYQALYTDNANNPVDLLKNQPFENDYTAGKTPLQQEGLFLEDMIYLCRTLYPNPQQNKLLNEIIDSYWNETIHNLKDLPAYNSKPEILPRIQRNLKYISYPFYQEDTPTTFDNRKEKYFELLSDIHYTICQKYENVPPKRQAALYHLATYTQAFEKRLNITQDKIIDKLLNSLGTPENIR